MVQPLNDDEARELERVVDEHKKLGSADQRFGVFSALPARARRRPPKIHCTGYETFASTVTRRREPNRPPAIGTSL